ncbi:MAG: type III-A CRISPR-associated RAMP protein Csm4 [Selenomonadaceae bacterium]|nr:type III-A CRISPR-associated RAMP protein Csm4 [Selenomonadaceae bacterium]
MSYYLYQLSFSTPVHFGDAAMGGKLEQIAPTISADILFSAVCVELVQQDRYDLLDRLTENVQSGEICFSDLFPYQVIGRDVQLFLPRPFLQLDGGKERQIADMQDARQVSAAKKLLKKQAYIRALEISSFMEAVAAGELYTAESSLHAGTDTMVKRVNTRGEESMPYYVRTYSFAENTGLYGIAKLPEDWRDTFQRIMESLGYSGIGGKRSSGYGHFTLHDDIMELLPHDNDTETRLNLLVDDTEMIINLLDRTESPWQMCLSVLCPEDAEAVKGGQYQLKKRSGFSENKKHDSIYMVAAGSCFRKRMEGRLLDLSGENDDHPIWRYGKGMYIGL